MKTWFRDLRLRRKLTVIIMITASGALLFSGVVLIAWDTFQRRSDFIRDLTTQADIVAENSVAALSFNDAEAAAETLATLQARPRVDAAALYDGHGRVIARYHRGSEHHVVPTVPGGAGYDFTADGLALFKPIHVKGTLAGTLYLHSDLSEFSSRARAQIAALALVLLASLGLAFIISNRLQTLVSGPILALAETARTVSREKDYSLRASPPGADELGTLVGAFNDMLAEIQQRESSLRESEATLRELADKLREAVRVRDDFLATAAHELRNPLNAIQLQLVGVLRLCQHDRKKVSSELISERVADATNSVRQFILLLENLLDVSRITSGRLDLEPEHIDLSTIVVSVVERFRGELGERQVIQHLTTATGYWDKIRLEQVLGNLLSNAIRYGEGKPIEISLAVEGAMAYLTVKDHGIGIEPEMQKRLFERFERGLTGRHRDRGGFGLGLWITKEIVEAMGGRISVDSRPGEGSAFRIVLPRDLAKTRESKTQSSAERIRLA